MRQKKDSRFLSVLLISVLLGSAQKIESVNAASQVYPPFKKVLIVVLENTDYQQAVEQPGFADFAKQGALFTNFSAETHPSQPNYIALISGDTHGVKSNNPVNLPYDHIGDRLEAKGLSWKAYIEDYPGNCFVGERNKDYVRKHNPFISFNDVRNTPSKCARIVPAHQLEKDAKAGTLPELALYIPNLKNDGHDTNPQFSSRWLSETLLPSLGNLKAQGLLVVLTFDENESKKEKENHIFTAFYGAGVRPGSQSSRPYNHYSLLKTIENRFELASLERNDTNATPITDVWN